MHAPSQTLPANSLGRQSQSGRNNDQRQQQQQMRNQSSNNGSNNTNRRPQQSNINPQNSLNSRKAGENARTPSSTSTYSHASQQSNYSSASRNPLVRNSSSVSQASLRGNNNNNMGVLPSNNPIPRGNTLNSLKRSQQQQQQSQQITSTTSSSTTTITSPHNSSTNRAAINERLRLATNPNNISDGVSPSNQDQSSQFYEKEHEYRTFIHFIELIYHVFVFGLVGFFIAACSLYEISYIYPFVVLFLYDGINILRTLQRFMIYTQYKCRFKSKIIMLEIVFLILTKIILLMHYIFGTNCIYAMFPITCYCILRAFIYKIEKHSEDCNSIINFLLIGHRVFVFIFMGSIALKLDKIVDWEWSQTIWPYWVMFSILIGLTFGSFLMTLSKCFQVCLAESHLDELKGIFWVFVNVSGVTAGSFLLLLGTIRYFDAKEGIVLEILMIFLGSFFIFYFSISVLWRNSIMKYLKQMSSFDPEYVRQSSKNAAEEEQRAFANRQAEFFSNNNGYLRGRNNNNNNIRDSNTSNNGNTRNLRNQQDNSNNMENIPSNQQGKQIDEEEEKSNNNEQSPVYVPRFLEKFSNTFFRKTDPTLNPTEYIKQKQQEKDEKKKKRTQILEGQQIKKQQQQQLAGTTTGSMSSTSSNQADSKKSSTQSKSNGKSQQKQTKTLRNESTISSSQQSDILSRRSSSSIVLNVHQPHPSKLQELLSQFKKGASQLIRSIRPIGGVGSGQGLPGALSMQACQQLPITESDEIKTQGNDDVIEFMTTEESQQEPQRQIIPEKQNMNINQQKLRTRKEQHVSIIETNGNIPGKSQQMQDSNQYQNRCHSLTANENPSDHLTNLDPREAMNQQQQTAQAQQLSDSDQYNMANHRRFLSVQEKNTEDILPGNDTPQQVGDNRINYQNNYRRSVESAKNGGLQILSDGVEEEYSVVSDSNRDNHIDNNNNNAPNSANNVNGLHDHSQINDQSSILSSSRVDKSSANTCLVCFDKPPDSVFMDCGHGGVCYECSLEIWKKTGECYLCRLKIAQVLQVDLKSKAYGLMKVISSTQMVQKDVDTSDLQQESQNASRQQQQGPLEEIQEDNQE